jgi:hypothetical protein
VVAMEADGKMRTLTAGTNGFSCMPDNPVTPGPDPCAWTRTPWSGSTRGLATSRPPRAKSV